MNRRQFTASLAALVATPALPLAAHVPVGVAPAVPPGAYAWAQLIARAQNNCSPEMLAKILHLKPDVAQALFKDMVVDGVLRAPGASGMAKAAQPFEGPGFHNSLSNRLETKAKDMAQRALDRDEPSEVQPPLVNHNKTCLGCDEMQPKDHANASPDQPPEEIPENG